MVLKVKMTQEGILWKSLLALYRFVLCYSLQQMEYNFTAKTWDSLISAQYSKEIGLDSERFTHSSLFVKDKLILCGYDGILIFGVTDKEILVLKTENVNDFYKIFIGKDNQLIIVYRTGKVIVIEPDSKVADVRKSISN